jgi:hypothetical protein
MQAIIDADTQAGMDESGDWQAEGDRQAGLQTAYRQA